MATALATRSLLLASRGRPSRPSSSPSSWLPSSLLLRPRPSRRLRSSWPQVDAAPAAAPGKGGEYRPSFADDLLLAFFRSKMVEEVGWDSEKPGYAGLMEVANRLMVKGKSALETEQAAVRVLQSLFPPLLLVLYKALLAPIADGQLAAMMLARATALSCQWLMGPCSVNSVALPDGKSWSSGVLICSNFQLILTQNLFLIFLMTNNRYTLRNASIWKRANALVFASTRANCQLRLSLKITWVLIYTWSQILKTIAASLTLECRLHLLILTKPSRNPAWTFAQMRGDAGNSAEIVARMSSVVPKFDTLLVESMHIVQSSGAIPVLIFARCARLQGVVRNSN